MQDAVDSIATISEQSAAGAEGVSGSTLEQTASVEQVSVGAGELSQWAEQVQEPMPHFKLVSTS